MYDQEYTDMMGKFLDGLLLSLLRENNGELRIPKIISNSKRLDYRWTMEHRDTETIVRLLSDTEKEIEELERRLFKLRNK